MPESEISERRRQATLIKKAKELSVLCSAEVAVISFTSDGKLHEYSSNSVEHTLSRYKDYKGGLVLPTKMESDPPEEQHHCETAVNKEEQKSNDKDLNALEGQHAALKLDKLRRTGKALDGLSRKELYALEQQQKWALVSVLKKKEELLVRLLQRSKLREQQVIQENEILKRGSEERVKEIPYLQLFPEKSSDFGTSSKVVSLLNHSTQDMDTGFGLGFSS